MQIMKLTTHAGRTLVGGSNHSYYMITPMSRRVPAKMMLAVLAITVANCLASGCSSAPKQDASGAKPYWAGGPKPMTPVQAAETYTYSTYHPTVAPGYNSAGAAAPPDGRSEYEAFVNGAH